MSMWMNAPQASTIATKMQFVKFPTLVFSPVLVQTGIMATGKRVWTRPSVRIIKIKIVFLIKI